MALYISHSFYNLQSYLSGENDLTAYVERTAAALVKRLMFLRDGFNENVSRCVTVNHADFFFRGKQETSPTPLSNTSSLTSSTRARIVSHNNALIFSAIAYLFSASP